jgi:hypothetical protein
VGRGAGRGRVGRQQLRGEFEDRRLEEVTGTRVEAQQLLDLAAQARVRAARPVEEGRALAPLALQRLREQLVNLPPSFWIHRKP